MKKRMLAFAVALIMVIGLLPLPTYAATPQPKFAMTDPNNSVAVSNGVAPGEAYYVVFEDVTDATTGEVIGNKPVMAETTPTDNYIKYYYNGAKNIFEITFKNINYQRTKSGDAFLTVSNNFTSSVTYANTFDVVLTLEGTNSISGPYATMSFKNNGNLTITGGELNVSTSYTSTSFLQKSNSGDLIFLNTTIDFANT